MRIRSGLIVLASTTAALAGCASLDRALNKAEQAIAVTNTSTAKSLSTIAKSNDREAAAKEMLKKRREVYKDNPQALINDIRQAQRDYQMLVDLLRGNVTRTWGKQEVQLPTRTHYVKYTQNYMSRAIVDFDAGKVTVETLDDKDPKASLRNAIVTTLLTPDDPRAVDLFSDNAVKLSSEREPYLKNLVVDHNSRAIAAPADAEAFADHLLAGKAATRSVTVEQGAKTALFVEIAMVANFANKQAEKYRDVVARVAQKYKISQSLVFGVIRTESNFNPFAVSSAPAYGMMQLVPTSGGREAYRRVNGQDGIPTKEELFDAERNIEFGTAYLGVLTYNQLEMIGNPVSREYCVISAYNTGPGNVLRTFNSKQAEAVNQINRMEPPAVFEKLKTSLPYEETRHYVQKVVDYRRQFVVPGGN